MDYSKPDGDKRVKTLIFVLDVGSTDVLFVHVKHGTMDWHFQLSLKHLVQLHSQGCSS